jgi:nucleolar protein 56
MDKFVYTNLFGTFLFKGNIPIAKKLFKDLEDRKHRLEYEKGFIGTSNMSRADESFIFPKIEEYREMFYRFNMSLTEKDLIKSVKIDILISQAISNVEELNRVINLLSKRLREWYGLHYPELDLKVDDNEIYAKLVATKKRSQLMKEFVSKTIGADLSEDHVRQMQVLAVEITSLMEVRESEKKYIESVMDTFCPNLKEVASATIAAELISHAGSLEKLAEMTSSTIQLLGAEKALFRHLKNKNARCPKHGIIINHPIIAAAKMSEKGRVSRHLASAISKAAKIDFFHRKEQGPLNNSMGIMLMDKLKKQIEQR